MSVDRTPRAEPAFARAVAKALGDVGTVLALGARSARYAPASADVRTVEAPDDAPPAADEALPAADGAVAAFCVQDWPDLERGLAAVRAATRGPVAVLTRDPERIAAHWLSAYAPEVVAADAARHPALDRIAAALGDDVTTTRLPVPFTSVEGFAEAYYARPERLLDADVRRSDPAWRLVDEMTARRAVAALRTALESGAWDDRHGRLRVQPTYDGSVVLLTTGRTLES